MLEGGFYPHRPAAVELRETHISWVFLAGERAYKVKKPITLPFLDYGTPERRHEMCREEVRLNRRLAPDIYLGVAAIARDGDGYALRPEDDPEAIEYAVEMRPVEEERSLAALAERGELGTELVDAVARRIASFHRDAESADPARRDPGLLRVTLEDNLRTLRAVGAGILSADRLDAAEVFTDRFLARLREQIEARSVAGLVRDCHGDLRAEHVIVPSTGELYVYDCVEFDPTLRQIDVAADLAFLVMDLARLGSEGLADRLLGSYREAGGDPGDDRLASFLAAYRAWVRSMVACQHLAELQGDDPERADLEAEARALLDLGHRFAWRARRPLLVVLCGISGSGKSTLAERLASLTGWPHISSDLIRKRRAGLAPTQRADPQQYSSERTAETYEEMGRSARRELERRGGAIVDATFHRRDKRAAFERGFAGGSTPRLFVECTAPPAVQKERARERERRAARVSDAGPEIVRRQLEELEPFAEVSPDQLLRLTTDAEPERLVARIESYLDRGGQARRRRPR